MKGAPSKVVKGETVSPQHCIDLKNLIPRLIELVLCHDLVRAGRIGYGNKVSKAVEVKERNDSVLVCLRNPVATCVEPRRRFCSIRKKRAYVPICCVELVGGHGEKAIRDADGVAVRIEPLKEEGLRQCAPSVSGSDLPSCRIVSKGIGGSQRVNSEAGAHEIVRNDKVRGPVREYCAGLSPGRVEDIGRAMTSLVHGVCPSPHRIEERILGVSVSVQGFPVPPR